MKYGLYGKAYIAGLEEYPLLVEYTYDQDKDKKIILVGRDLVTDTPLIGTKYPLAPARYDLEQAIYNNDVKKGTLLLREVSQTTETEMVGLLKGMTREDLEVYLHKIHDVKEEYSAAINKRKKAQKAARKKEKNSDNSIKKQKKRIRLLLDSIYSPYRV